MSGGHGRENVADCFPRGGKRERRGQSEGTKTEHTPLPDFGAPLRTKPLTQKLWGTFRVRGRAAVSFMSGRVHRTCLFFGDVSPA